MTDLAPFYRGDTKVFKLTLKNDNGASPPTPVDVTGNVFWITFKTDAALPDYKCTLQHSETAAAGGTPVSDPSEGLVYITLSSEETALLAGNTTYYYDIQRVIPGSPPVVSTLQSGKVKVLQDVTQKVTA